MEPTITDWMSAVCSLLSLLIACGALIFAYKQINQANNQLKNMNETFRNTTLMTVLELENELIRRKAIWKPKIGGGIFGSLFPQNRSQQPENQKN